MENRFKNKKILSVLCALVVLLVLCFLFGLTPLTANAEGNITNDGDINCATLKMDVNGKIPASSAPERNNDDISANNALFLKTRFLHVSSIMSAYCKYSSKADSIYNASNFALTESNIYSSSNDFLKIEPTNDGESISLIKLTAKEKNENARITLIFNKKPSAPSSILEETINVYVKVDITSSPVVGLSASEVLTESNRTIKVKLGDGINNAISMPNKSKIEIPLKSYLISKELYTAGENGDALVKNADGSPWTFSDVKHLEIEKVKIENDIVPLSNIYYTNTDGKFDPIINIDVLFNEEAVKNNKKAVDGKTGNFFWGEDGAYFNLDITLKCTSPTKSIQLQYKVAFAPGSKLSIKENLGMPNELNATSEYEYMSSADLLNKELGFRKVRVRVSDITDYPTFDSETKNYKQYFRDNDAETPSDKTNTVLVERVVLSGGEVVYDIIGQKNGSVVLKFKPYYKDINGNSTNMEVNVTFVVYGKYSVDFMKMEGKSKKTFNVNNATEFEPLTKDFFRLESAEVVNNVINGTDTDTTMYASATVKGGYLEVSPLITGKTNLKLTFINSSGQKVVVSAPIIIDIESGNFFNTWELWQIILLIVGCSIALIILILFIIWIFIRSISKSKQDELESSAPTSAYIIKLNSTIAAAQAQQRLATTQAFAAQTQMLQLGSGPVTQGAPAANTLQLGSAPAAMTAPPAGGVVSGGTMTMPPNSDINITAPMPAAEEIYIPISDEELIERIFVEKYEPRGMARRSFFKSKDLQSKELEKEKARIREEVRAGKSIEEACKSQKQRDEAIALGGDAAPVVAEETDSPENSLQAKLIKMLGFNPAEPIIVTEQEEFLSDNMLEEEVQLKRSESQCARLEELKKICISHHTKIESELTKMKSSVEKDNNDISIFENDIKKKQDSITDIEIKMATAKNKEKEKFTKDLAKCESDIAGANKQIAKLQSGLEEKNNLVSALTELSDVYAQKNSENDELISSTKAKIVSDQGALANAKERAAAAQKIQENERKAGVITPLIRTANIIDRDIRALENTLENDVKEKDAAKAQVSAMQTQLLGTTDVAIISNLSASIAELNKRISELDKAITANTKSKSDKNIELTGVRRKCNDIIDKENMETEHVIAVEDKILGEITLEDMVKTNETDLVKCEKDVEKCQLVLDDLISSADTKLLNAAGSVAAAVKEAEDNVAKVDAELNELNAKMEEASDDDKLMLSIDQMSLNEKLVELSAALDEIKANGIKANLEIKVKNEAEIESARNSLEMAKQEYEKALERHNNASTAANPTDLITSGSGIISQDRQKIEAASLRKQLEKSKNALEQANLQAKMAQMEAEKAIIDAQRASQASKEEAEKLAQEAIAKAEQAKQEAKLKADEETKKAMEEVEAAKRKVEEDAQKARDEVEIAKRKAEEETEAIKARLEEEQKAAIRALEDEKNKIVEEEAQRNARKAEEEAKKAQEEAAKAAAIADKIHKRKNSILEIRKELNAVKDQDQAKEFYEKFYAISLDFDNDEKADESLTALINKSMDDALHAGEVKHYQSIADKAPKRVVKKVTERVNKIQRPTPRPGATGARPAGARPAGARPAGARPGAPGARPAGARPGAPGARPAGARPAGARPIGARPTAGARPVGARPAPGARPAGARPTGAPGTRPTAPRPPRQ